MKRLLLDLDDTFVNTEWYIRNLIKNEGLGNPPESVYMLRYHGVDNYREVVEEVLRNYPAIPLTIGAEDSLQLLKSEFDVYFCSCYISESERKSKEEFAEMYQTPIILVGNEDFSKSSVDTKGCILIDDSLDVLKESKADVNIQMYNPYNSKGLTFKDYMCGDHLVSNLPEAVDVLLEGGIGDNDVSEKLRRFVRSRVQEKCQAVWG